MMISIGIVKNVNVNVSKTLPVHFFIFGTKMNAPVFAPPKSALQTNTGIAHFATVSVLRNLAIQAWSGTERHANAIVYR